MPVSAWVDIAVGVRDFLVLSGISFLIYGYVWIKKGER